jgi:hypothetical protein
VEFAGDVIFDGTEEGASGVSAMAGHGQVFLDEPLRWHVDRNEAHPVALAFYSKMQHPLAALGIAHPHSAK